MAEQKAGSKAISGFLSLVVLIGLGWYSFGARMGHQAARNMQKIENHVAEDAVAQYNIARESGFTVHRCVQAGIVAAAYLQAKDQGNYREWKGIERTDCEAAGMPEQ